MIHVAFLIREPLTARRPLADQRADADKCMQRIRDALGAEDLRSRSHSRGLAAATAASGPSALGLDAEYADSRRPWPAIIAHYAQAPRIEGAPVDALCRGWTFLEAWYKAFGAWPSSEQVCEAVGAQPESPAPVSAGEDIYRFHMTPAPGFSATLVWKGPPDLPALHRVD